MRRVAFIIFAIVVSLFAFKGEPAFGAGSPMTTGTGCGSPYADFSNCTSLYDSDSSYSTYTRSSADGRVSVSGYDFFLSGNATITDVKIYLKGYATGGAYNAILLNISKTGDANYFGNISGSCSANYTAVLSGSNTEYYATLPVSCWPSHTFSPADFGTDFAVNLNTSTNGTPVYFIDSVKTEIRYTLPPNTIQVDSATASPSGQYVALNLSGSTSTHSADMQCDIGLFEKCSKEGYAGWVSATPVTHIKLDGSYTGSSTIATEYGAYTAHGWGNSADWSVEGVRVPYNAGYECTYPYSIYCTVDHRVIFSSSYGDNPALVATPSSGLSAVNYSEPEPSNPLAWVVWKLRQTAFELFVPHSDYVQQGKELLQENVESRAPFAYVNAALSLDWSGNAPTATAAPTIVFPVTNTGGGVLSDVSVPFPSILVSALGTIRGAFNIMLWLLFIVYLIIRIRSVL